MNKKSIGIIMLILIAIIAIFALVNRGLIKNSQEAHANAEVLITGDNVEDKFTYDQIIKLGEEEFTAIFDSSNTDPEEHKYTGIPLKNLIEEAEIRLEDKQQVNIRAIDGYTVALKPDEVLEDENVYLAYKQDGEPIKSKEEGGSGPYQVIIRKDAFSQRWCKFVAEIEIK
ncbi:molybdopterin-dependent oxidoreductase-like protein [Alkalibaculum bacchi]|uniref:Molybdopterin-dependent oxidoreductase-like protein n=1 Tax=Alkalibaculum bacchi TaxID=645887 RepID=A0A366I206_9FIRM|nr:molybdopterin-dependent oxidoreductase [Alkalibaculum bacchi]RBP59676.1 molybdopterin-dependent oxidoreductase-like protein [Alkalibaculum bacchi]